MRETELDQRWSLFLDLDDTIVLTAAIKSLRDSRNWPEVYKAFSRTRLPNGTPEFFNEWHLAVKLGVITNSPRAYAQGLLKHHDLDIPVVIGYHDTKRHKPHGDPIVAALKAIRGEASRCIYIGDLLEDAQAARAARVHFIGICWDRHSTLGRGAETCRNWSQVSREIRRKISAK